MTPDEIEYSIANNGMTPAQVFTQMRTYYEQMVKDTYQKGLDDAEQAELCGGRDGIDVPFCEGPQHD